VTASPKRVTLRPLPRRYAVSRLPPSATIPDWAEGAGFVSISRTADELSVVCEEERVPAETHSDRGWHCLAFVGPFAFDETGIAVAVLGPLADAGIGVLLIATYDTDYLLLKAGDLARAQDVLVGAGHRMAG
jgi:hypothetical protein